MFGSIDLSARKRDGDMEWRRHRFNIPAINAGHNTKSAGSLHLNERPRTPVRQIVGLPLGRFSCSVAV